ncbi:hypothetical protein Pmar_PMAR009374 [Perkinsus marinus ATCC 50983]|uniref:Uncharacterized protein n=1 Tax=Perkinsus marinus (strain ATCC 50983 / TXsc) TaxID=423536 RepID=C5LVI9_PERM5|nr:hypothetical protein Pmar_PMAR009374 [Perkinsus marinus ATCC 50983]EEQ99253.1 hypothetical protein Pmar_PMAR009374 [Perkinsus marinus ATCC 50983]|eukprot:XP_002766536.1 hypothetical protein Pmar_PMAR009374 [Perkinsus marinus ATCC 50983]
MRMTPCNLFQVVLIIGLLVNPQLAEVAALGKYHGWDDDYRFFCIINVKSSSKMQITADVDLRRRTNGGECVNCHFIYGLSKVLGKTNGSENNVDLLSQVDPTTECLNQLGEVIGVGDHCRWNAYPYNGRMVLDGCGSHWDLPHAD